jgi:predicted esterase
MKHSFMLSIAFAFLTLCASAGEAIIKDSQGMDCFVYTPDPLVPETTYQLVVGVHGVGGNGNGACGLKNWAARGDVIVIGPSFVAKGDQPYQSGDGIHAEKLIDLFKTLQKNHKLKEKMFLHGFSGGAQFIHRFAMLHPEHVCGVSAHSAGSWATDNFGEITNSAKKIPFAISCGEKDTAKSFPEAPFTRMEWFGRFRDELEKKNFTIIAATWPDVGHSMSSGVIDLAKQCFQISTGLPGESATTEVTISDTWKNLKEIKPTTPQNPSREISVNSEELDKMSLAAFAKADTEEIPRENLITFMRKYPPALWKDKPGSEKLLKQCERAAKEWYDAAKEKNLWSDKAKQEFKNFSDGLDIETE